MRRWRMVCFAGWIALALGWFVGMLQLAGCDVRPPDPQRDAAQPAPSDFEIVGLRAEWDGDYFRAFGELRNNGSAAAGAQIEFSVRDASGNVVAVKKYWPASIGNIPAGDTRGLDYRLTDDRRAQSVRAKVVAVRIWK